MPIPVEPGSPLAVASGTAIISLLVGDDTALGYGSAASQVRQWPSDETSLSRGLIWDKWTGARDTAADTGAGFIPITRAMGDTTDDVGLEYGIAEAMQSRSGDADALIIKYATASAQASPTAPTAKSFHPLAGAGSALSILIDGYVTPALAAAKATYSRVLLEAVYVSIGLEDARGAGNAEAFAGNAAASINAIRAAFGADVPIRFIIPPLVDRDTWTGIDLVRYFEQLMDFSGFFDADVYERGGLGDGVTPLNSVLSGQGIVSLGTAVAQQAQRLVVLK